MPNGKEDYISSSVYEIGDIKHLKIKSQAITLT